jgi:UDP-glucose 4-epimerase
MYLYFIWHQVMDLAEGHVAALKYMGGKSNKGFGQYSVFNLGTGVGYSVLDMVKAMKDASGRYGIVLIRYVMSYDHVRIVYCR